MGQDEGKEPLFFIKSLERVQLFLLFPEVVFSVLDVGAEGAIASVVESVSVIFLTLKGKEGNFCFVVQNVRLALNFKNKFHGRPFPSTEVQSIWFS